MPEQLPKIPQSASPVMRSGAGDISETELSRERRNLQYTPPTSRVQPAHPKKQLFSVPVNKFTAKRSSPSGQLLRIRTCLDEMKCQTPVRAVAPRKMRPKAVSMEDLTPSKRVRREKERKDEDLPERSELESQSEEQAAARVARFMMLACWRKRRDEVKWLRKTLDFQRGCSERLRMQVSALKHLLDSDNAKVRLAMQELDRLKQLLRDKDMEKTVLLREKLALEHDVCAAEDRASEMSIGWRNCRNELEGVRAAAAVTEHALAQERAVAQEARAQWNDVCQRLSEAEEEIASQERVLSAAEGVIKALKKENTHKQKEIEDTKSKLKLEQEARDRCTSECAELNSRLTVAVAETNTLKGVVKELQGEIARLDGDLRLTREQLDWWPKPLTKMLGAARSLFRYPVSLPEAVLWSMVPARHGC